MAPRIAGDWAAVMDDAGMLLVCPNPRWLHQPRPQLQDDNYGVPNHTSGNPFLVISMKAHYRYVSPRIV